MREDGPYGIPRISMAEKTLFLSGVNKCETIYQLKIKREIRKKNQYVQALRLKTDF